MPHATKETLFGKDSNVVLPDDKGILPQSIKFFDGVKYPFVSDWISIAAEHEGRISLIGHLLWGVNEVEKEFIGPFPFKWNISIGDEAVNKKDNTVSFIGGRYTTDGEGTHAYGSDKTWQTRVFTYDFKSPPKALDKKLEKELDFPRKIFWSDILGGYIISSVKEKEFASIISRTYLLKDTNLNPLELRDASFVKDIPELNLVAVLDTYNLYFLDGAGNLVLSQRINSGDDYNGWDDIHLLEDNWLYIVGAQYDHVLQIAKNKLGNWYVKTTHRIVEADGVNNFLMWLFGFRTEQNTKWQLTSTYSAGRCRQYSPITKQMIFCDDNAILKDGRLANIKDNVSLEWYVGDLDIADVSLFWGDNNLYSFDGYKWTVVSKNISRGFFEKPYFIDRSFYTTRDGKSYEIKLEKTNISLIPIKIKNGEMFTRFLSFPNTDKVFVFTRKEVSILDEVQVSSLERSTNTIDITGHMTPKYIPAMKGIIFSAVSDKKHKTFNLLEKCE